MLKYEYLCTSEDGFVFFYYPEGNKNAPGKVVLTEKGCGRVATESADDFGCRYAFHAIYGIDITKQSGTVAWH